MVKLSEKSQPLKQSGIRAASVRCAAIGGINLGQGVCDIPMESTIKQAAYEAIERDKNLYSPYNGIRSLRYGLAEKIQGFNQFTVNPDTELMVTHGSTGAFVCAAMTLFNPGDEVIIFEPFYGYHKNILKLNSVKVVPVPIDLKDLTIDMDQVKAAITPNTKGMIICTPNNPTGKVYSETELRQLGEIAKQQSLWVITDEIYEYITYPGHEHVCFARLDDFFERTVTISGFSKTYNMTGWRIGYASAPAAVIEKMSLLQDLVYVCPPTPLQHAGLAALALEDSYYQDMAQHYLEKRDQVVTALNHIGFKVPTPQGAYYLMADISSFDDKNDQVMANYLLEQAKVATVPGRAFYDNEANGHQIIRLCYALQSEKINQALERIEKAL